MKGDVSTVADPLLCARRDIFPAAATNTRRAISLPAGLPAGLPAAVTAAHLAAVPAALSAAALSPCHDIVAELLLEVTQRQLGALLGGSQSSSE